MLKKITRSLFSPDEMVTPFLLYSLLFAICINLLSNILSDRLGDFPSLVISLFTILCIVIVLIIHEKRKEKNRIKSIDSSIESGKLKSKYKGLITFVSEPRLKDQNEKEYLEKCQQSIKDYKETKNVNKIANIPGIGQTFRALDYHLKTGELRYCWLICSEQSSVNIDVLKKFFEIVNKNAIEIGIVKIDDSNDSKHIKEKIENIYRNLPTDYKETDIIADITPGNKPMTAAMVLACLRSDRNIEYIEQSEKNELIEVDISPKFMGVEL